jgi:tetratricopeptide (TPR) repeat protein
MTDKPASALDRYYPFILVGVLSISVNANTLFNDFVFDDVLQILENRWITDVRFLPDIFSTHMAGFSGEYSTSYYRPLIHLLYMAGYHIFGYAPWGFHLINILFHTAVSLLVYLVSIRLFTHHDNSRGPLSPPLLAALLFAVHPVHTEAVAWVAGVVDISFSLFYILSFYMYLLSGEEERSFFNRYYLVSLGAFSLAALCKEPALTLPLLLAAYDYRYPGKESRFAACVKRYLPFLALSAVYILARVYALKGFAPGKTAMALSGYQYVLNAFPLFAKYLEKLLLPVNLSPVHVFHPVQSILEARSVLGILITLAFLMIIIITRKNNALFLGLSILAIPLLPAFYISAISGEGVFAERYLYLPTFGFALVLAFLFSQAGKVMPGKSLPATLIAAALIGTFSIGTVARNTDWKDGIRLWSDAVEKYPQSAVAHQYFGFALYSKGNIDEAIGEYRKALELNPTLFDARFNLGVAYHSKGSIDQAIGQYQLALIHHPGSASTHNGLGMAYGRKGDLDKAIEHFQAAVDLAPGDGEARKNLLMAVQMKKTPGGVPPSDRP